jgi:CcmD family protein
METFVAGYLIVWFAVVLYVARMGHRQRQLGAKYDALQAAQQSQEKADEWTSKAA